MAHSIEIRQKALAYWEKCNDINLVIEAFGVSRAVLYSWKKQLKETGELSPKNYGTKPRKIDRDKLKAYVEQNADAYLHEIAEHFNCTAPAVFYALKSINITLKKRPPPTLSKTQ